MNDFIKSTNNLDLVSHIILPSLFEWQKLFILIEVPFLIAMRISLKTLNESFMNLLTNQYQ